jgi:DNA-binding NarL/FixJ family response regulator
MNKILIVEDEAVLREAYVTLFKLEKFKVYQAANGLEALQQLPLVKPEIIILDVLMPDMGGIEFLKTALLAKNYPFTKVLMLTNLSDPKTLQQLSDLGVDKYILKSSITPSQLVKTVRDIIKT